MILLLLNKIMYVLFFLCTLNTIRHAYYFAQTLIMAGEDVSAKYRLNNKNLILLGLSIAYIITCIFTGIKI
jgi:ABC-type enterochelin transport system permease subunit